MGRKTLLDIASHAAPSTKTEQIVPYLTPLHYASPQPKQLVSIPSPFHVVSWRWIQKVECHSWSPVIFWLSGFLSFLTARNFGTIVCDAWKPKGCTIAWLEEKSQAQQKTPQAGANCCLNHMHCLLQGISEWESLGIHGQEVCTGFEFLMQITCNYRCVKKGIVRHKDKLCPT